jgi:hypothetical protein
MTISKAVGRWLVTVTADDKGSKVVKIADTKFHSNGNPQHVATYSVKTFLCQQSEGLILDGFYSEWVMSFIELYQAQVFVYQTQFLDGDIKITEHINGGIIG